MLPGGQIQLKRAVPAAQLQHLPLAVEGHLVILQLLAGDNAVDIHRAVGFDAAGDVLTAFMEMVYSPAFSTWKFQIMNCRGFCHR